MSEPQLSTRTEEPQGRAPLAMTSRGIQLANMDEMARFCVAVCKSRLAPKGFETPEAVMVAVQTGLEIGLTPMQALQSVAVINGRPCVWGDASLALVKAHPECADVIETLGDDGATCEVQRRGKAPVIRSFTVADAKKAGLWGKAGPWTNYPKRMLQMRARSWALRDAFPDALKGIGSREEALDIPPAPLKAKLVLPDEPASASATQAPALPETALTASEPEPLSDYDLWESEGK